MSIQERKWWVLISWATGAPIKRAAAIGGVSNKTARRWIVNYIKEYGRGRIVERDV